MATIAPLIAEVLPRLPEGAAPAAAPEGGAAAAAAAPVPGRKTFAVLVEARAAAGLPFQKLDLIKEIAERVPAPHKVDLGDPDVTIFVQILKARVV